MLYKSLPWNAIVTVDLLSLEQPEVKVSAKSNNKTIKSLGISKKVWNHARNLECLPDLPSRNLSLTISKVGQFSFFFFTGERRYFQV